MEQPLKASPKKYAVTFSMIFTGLAAFLGGSFIFGWNITCMSVPGPYIKAFMNQSVIDHYGSVLSPAQVDMLFSLATLLYTVGGAIGAFFAGKLADQYGRKKSVLLMHTVGVLGGVFYGICQICNAIELLMAARFFVGLGAGACFAIVPMYANEIAPAHVRGAVSACSQLFITIGIFVATCFVLEDTLGSVQLWPVGAASMVIFSVISIIMLLLPWSVESPKWFLNVKKDDEGGKTALKKLYNLEDVDELMAEIKAESQVAKSDGPQEEWGYVRLFRTSYLRWPVTFVACLNAAQQCSGINVVFFFAASLYMAAGLTGKMISFAALAVSGVNVLATLVSIWLIDRLGRRALLLFPMLGMVLMMGLEIMFLYLQNDERKWMSFACIGCMVVYVICFAVGLGPIPLFIGSEMLRPEPRASAMALGGVVNLCGTLLVALLFETVISRFLDVFSFLPFMILTLGFLILFWVKLPETKNKSIPEIYKELGVTETDNAGGQNIEMEEGRGLLAADKDKHPVA